MTDNAPMLDRLGGKKKHAVLALFFLGSFTWFSVNRNGSALNTDSFCYKTGTRRAHPLEAKNSGRLLTSHRGDYAQVNTSWPNPMGGFAALVLPPLV